jgi:hypothetical protein
MGVMIMMMTVVVVIMVAAHGCYLLFSGITAKGQTAAGPLCLYGFWCMISLLFPVPGI